MAPAERGLAFAAFHFNPVAKFHWASMLSPHLLWFAVLFCFVIRHHLLMPREIADIVHLTDMHLYVDSRGNLRPPSHRAWSVRSILKVSQQRFAPQMVKSLARGLNRHSGPALRALIKTLNIIVHGASTKLVVVQSGDMEAYGGTLAPRSISFPAYDYWRSQCQRIAGRVDQFVDVYGNHDVWPGTLPIFDPSGTIAVEHHLRQLSEFRDPMPNLLVTDCPSLKLEFYRVNTVQSIWTMGTLAQGRFGNDCPWMAGCPSVYPLSRSTDLNAELMELAKHSASRLGVKTPTLRVLVMHHPPHFFNATGKLVDLREGALQNPNIIQSACQAGPFHLVLAGHRHALNPAHGTRYLPSFGGQPQPPLPGNTVQLVAGSPTQEVAPDDDRPSFSVYKIREGYQLDKFEILRVVYRLQSDLDKKFTAEPEEILVDGLPI